MSEDFFGDLGKTISGAASDIVDRTGDFFESAKVKAQIQTELKAIDKNYRAIGEMIYKLHESGTPVSSEVVHICEDIDMHQDQIKEFNAQIASIKGEQVCANCGERMRADAAFCPKCGSTAVREAETPTDMVDDSEPQAAPEEEAPKVETPTDDQL